MGSYNDYLALMGDRPMPFYLNSETERQLPDGTVLPYQTQSETDAYFQPAQMANQVMQNVTDEISGKKDLERKLMRAALIMESGGLSQGSAMDFQPVLKGLLEGTSELAGVAPSERVMDRLQRLKSPVLRPQTAFGIGNEAAGLTADLVQTAMGAAPLAGAAGKAVEMAPAVGKSIAKVAGNEIGAVGKKIAGAEAEATAPVWYSQMAKTIESKLPGSGTPEQFASTIESFAKKGEFKAEELECSGVQDFIKSQKGKVSKQDVLDYVKNNNFQVQEVVKGRKDIGKMWQDFDGWSVYLGDNQDINVNKHGDGRWYIWDVNNKRAVGESYQSIEEAKYAAQDLLSLKVPKYDNTVYGQYQTPGGKNYREMLLTLPGKTQTDEQIRQYAKRLAEKSGESWESLGPNGQEQFLSQARRGPEGAFTSSHYQEPDIIAHIRFNDRIDADGKKTLFIEEVQSDWAQKGRKEGFGGIKDDATNKLIQEVKKLIPDMDITHISTKDIAAAGGSQQLQQRWFEAVRGEKLSEGVPDAPFVKDTGKWSMLAMKRMVRYAADNGYDRVAWTTGDMQAARYDLSKQISKVEYVPKTKNLIAWDINGENVLDKTVEPNKVEDYIGKDLAKKLVESNPSYQTGSGNDVHKLEGLDLKVGGEGMKGFYDKILPSEMNKFFNKEQWGKARVGTTEIETVTKPKNTQFGPVWKSGDKAETISVHSIDITPQMKAKATREGMPLFSIAGAAGLANQDKE